MPGPSDVPPLSTECTHPWTVFRTGLMLSMEGAVDDIKLLLARELDEVHGVTGHPDRELGVKLRGIHGMQEGFAVEDVDVDVVAALGEVAVQHAHQIGVAFLGRTER